MAWLSAHEEIQFLNMPIGTPLWLASIQLSGLSSCHLPSCKLCSSLKSLEYAMLSLAFRPLNMLFLAWTNFHLLHLAISHLIFRFQTLIEKPVYCLTLLFFLILLVLRFSVLTSLSLLLTIIDCFWKQARNICMTAIPWCQGYCSNKQSLSFYFFCSDIFILP